MKITGYRSLTTHHEWGRVVGDVNGLSAGTRTRVDILVLTTDEGLEGISIGAHRDIERLMPALEGADPRAVVHLYDRMLAATFKLGHVGAVFGTLGTVDCALWDLKAKLAGEPLWRHLGAGDRFVPGYASALDFGLSDDDLVGVHERFAERGFTSAKLKGGRQVQDDLRRLGLLREVFTANTSAPGLMFDANESWHRSQAVRYLHQLEQSFDLTWVEEPVRRWDVRGHASIRQHIRAGVASGENLTGLEQLRSLIDGDAIDVAQVGSGWGITHLLRAAHVAHAYDLPVSPVGYTATVAAAAAALPNLLVAEVQDLAHPVGVAVDQQLDDGGIVLGDEPGSGFSVDESALQPAPPEQGWSVDSGPHTRPLRAGLRMVPEDDTRGAERPEADADPSGGPGR
jgi:L-alanine-DL-glutamate epimerase-like enolase superfamily enzyme